MKRMLIVLASLAALWFTAGDANAQSCEFSVENATLSGDPTTAVSVQSRVWANCSSGEWLSLRINEPITVCPALGAGVGSDETMSSGDNDLKYRFYMDQSLKTPVSAIKQGFVVRVSKLLFWDFSASHSFAFYTALLPNQPAVVGKYADQPPLAFYYRWGDDGKCSSLTGKAFFPKFTVTMNVDPYCDLSTEPVDFGSTGTLDTAIKAEGKITVACTKGSRYKISLDGGKSKDLKNRLMYSGTNKVKYNLYLDGNRTNIWGTEPDATADGLADGANPIPYKVHGLVPIQPTPPSGVYMDSVKVVVESN